MKWRDTKHCEKCEGVAQRLVGEMKPSEVLSFALLLGLLSPQTPTGQYHS